MNDTDNWTIIGMLDGFDEKVISQIAVLLKEHHIPCTVYGSVFYCVKVMPSDTKRARELLLSSVSKWENSFRVVDENGQPISITQPSIRRKGDFWGTREP